jgi:hypothetical protein
MLVNVYGFQILQLSGYMTQHIPERCMKIEESLQFWWANRQMRFGICFIATGFVPFVKS